MSTDASFIAVVDDEESVLKALERLLRAEGFSVETFSSGADFLRSVQRHRPHCVVLDLHMTQLSGFQVQQELRKTHAGLPVVIITGDDAPESRARALSQGAKAFLRKPVDDSVLLDAIHAAIRDSRATTGDGRAAPAA
jgi:FixJ family two-component response regulator